MEERFARCCIEERVSYGGCSWTVWEDMSADGTTKLAFVSGPGLPSLNGPRHIEEYLEPHEELIFMQSNAISEVGITVLGWPARSPDMNPT